MPHLDPTSHRIASDALRLLDGFREVDADALARAYAKHRAPLDSRDDDARGALILAGAAAQCADLARALCTLAERRARMAHRAARGIDGDADLAETLAQLESATAAARDASRAAVDEIRALVSA